MGKSKSSEIVATDNMSVDKNQSFNVVSIHSPTAGLGLSLAFGMLCMYVCYKVYRHFCLTPCGLRKERRKERQAPTLGISLDMTELHMPGVGESLKCLECQHHAWMPAPKPPGDDFCQALPLRATYRDDLYPTQVMPPRASIRRRAVSRSGRVSLRSPPRRPRSLESF